MNGMSTEPANSGKKLLTATGSNHEQHQACLNPPGENMWSKTYGPHHRLCFFGGSLLAETKNPKMCWSKPGINSSTLLNPGSRRCHHWEKWWLFFWMMINPYVIKKKWVKLVYPPLKTNGWLVGLPGEIFWLPILRKSLPRSAASIAPSFQAPQLFAATCDIAERGIIVLVFFFAAGPPKKDEELQDGPPDPAVYMGWNGCPYRWPCKWVSGVVILLKGVISSQCITRIGAHFVTVDGGGGAMDSFKEGKRYIFQRYCFLASHSFHVKLWAPKKPRKHTTDHIKSRQNLGPQR